VLKLTDSPLALGVVGALQFTPMLLFSVFAGALIDRIPKRRLLLVTQSVLTGQAILLGVLTLTGVVQYWHVAVLAFGLGIANTLDMPGRQSFIKEMVEKEEHVMNAIALNSTVFNLARMLGPAVAGVLIATLGMGWVFIANAFTFLPVIFGIYLMKAGRRPAKQTSDSVMESAKEGLVYVRSKGVLLRALLLLLAVSLFSINFNVVIPVLAKAYLHQDAKGYGFLMSSMGVGALIGAGVLILMSRQGPRPALVYSGAIGLSVFQMLLPLSHNLMASATMLMFTGMSMIIFISTINSSLQINSADEYRGRVMSLYTLVFGGSTPVGNLIIGWIAEHLGVAFALVFGGGVGLATTLAYAAIRNYTRRPKPA
jgi:MFS family permease